VAAGEGDKAGGEPGSAFQQEQVSGSVASFQFSSSGWVGFLGQFAQKELTVVRHGRDHATACR
jgi:hypothetical protein